MSSASSSPTGVTRDGFPRPGGSNGLCITDVVLPILPTLAVVVAKLSEDAKGANPDIFEGLGWLFDISAADVPEGVLLESFELDDVVPPTDGDSESLERTFSSMEDSKPRLTSGAAAVLSVCGLGLFQLKIFISCLEAATACAEYSKGGSANGKSALIDG